MWRAGDVSGVLRGWALECERLRVCDDRSEAIWRDSSSTRSNSPAVVGHRRGNTRCGGLGSDIAILSAKCEAESRLPSLAGEYDLDVRWQTGADGAKNVVRYVRCQALEVPKELGWFPVAHILMRVFSNALFVRWTTGAPTLL